MPEMAQTGENHRQAMLVASGNHFCIAAYKVPRAVHWWDALPRNAAGKLLRRVLRDGLAS